VTKGPSSHTLPTVTGFGAKQVIAALEKRDFPVESLLNRAGLSKRNFDGRQHRISAMAEAKLLEYSAEALDDNTFGLHLAEQANPREVGLLFYVGSAGKNLSEALELVERYLKIVNEAMHLKLIHAPKCVDVEVRLVGLSRHTFQQGMEFSIAVILKGLREITGRNIRPLQTTFIHVRNSNLRQFERFFGCPVIFGAASDQLTFSKETIALPLVTRDPYLLETLQPFCDDAAKQRHTAPGTLRASVENELQKSLSQGSKLKKDVAKSLGLSVRTLSRRLAEEGTAYDEVVDQLRRSLALQYIRDPSISLAEMTWLLGYERTTSFNHAFKRWMGHSPSATRQQKQPPSAR
jgi:AraC-like DNA-binding protein